MKVGIRPPHHSLLRVRHPLRDRFVPVSFRGREVFRDARSRRCTGRILVEHRAPLMGGLPGERTVSLGAIHKEKYITRPDLRLPDGELVIPEVLQIVRHMKLRFVAPRHVGESPVTRSSIRKLPRNGDSATERIAALMVIGNIGLMSIPRPVQPQPLDAPGMRDQFGPVIEPEPLAAHLA